MLKSLLRFSLLFAFCTFFVYAPEILSAVSTPYPSPASQRVSLRIVLSCSHEVSASLQKTIDGYQKRFPAVYLRIVNISDDFLDEMASSYPNIVFCSESAAARLPPSFICVVRFASPHVGQPICCAIRSGADDAALQFAAYIKEAAAAFQPLPQI